MTALQTSYSTPPCGYKPNGKGYQDNMDGSKSDWYFKHIEMCPECQRKIKMSFWDEVKMFIKSLVWR